MLPQHAGLAREFSDRRFHNHVVMLVKAPRGLKGPSPALATVHRIEKVLRQAARRGEGPCSYVEIERRLPVKKIRRETLTAASRSWPGSTWWHKAPRA
jgi:hypothetical protein